MISNLYWEVCQAFEKGFKNEYGYWPKENIPAKDKKHLVNYGAYMTLESTNEEDLPVYAYEYGRTAARSLKYERRKSIRLGKVLGAWIVVKKPLAVSDPLEQKHTMGFKTLMDVSPQERRTE